MSDVQFTSIRKKQAQRVLRNIKITGKQNIIIHLKGKFTPKPNWSEIKEPTRRRRASLTVCKYLFSFPRYFISKFQTSLRGGRHDSHFLNRNETKMTSQLQYRKQEEILSLDNSRIQEHGHFKSSGIIVFLNSNQKKLITLLPWQPKKQYSPFDLAAETAIMVYMGSISNI